MTTTLPPALADIASQAEAEAGTATDKFMTPQRTKQAISAGMTLMTEQTASGTETEFDFTSIPDHVRRINILFAALKPNTNNDILVQIGDSGGLETSGYVSAGGASRNGSTGVASGSATNTGFEMDGDGFGPAGFGIVGIMTLIALDSGGTKWASFHSVGASSSKAGGGGGYKALSARLDRLRIVSVTDTDVFNSGSVQVMYE